MPLCRIKFELAFCPTSTLNYVPVISTWNFISYLRELYGNQPLFWLKRKKSTLCICRQVQYLHGIPQWDHCKWFWPYSCNLTSIKSLISPVWGCFYKPQYNQFWLVSRLIELDWMTMNFNAFLDRIRCSMRHVFCNCPFIELWFQKTLSRHKTFVWYPFWRWTYLESNGIRAALNKSYHAKNFIVSFFPSHKKKKVSIFLY